MNLHLQKILDLVSKADRVTEREKAALAKEIEDAEKVLEQQGKTVAAQSRELEIEAALERVRSRTMAMYKSEELGEVIGEFFNQMNPMGLARWGCALWLADETHARFNVLFTSPTDPDAPLANEVPVVDRPVINDIWSAYKRQKSHFNLELRGKEKDDFDTWFLEQTGMQSLPITVKQEIRSHNYVQFSFVAMRCGLLGAVDIEAIENKKIEIVQRFAKVFDQTYTRFLDLQKAEAQAREAQIQLGLERVRARAMAMHTSAELSDASVILYRELKSLGMTQFFNCGYVEIDEPNKIQHGWTSTFEGDETEGYILPLTGDEVLDERYKQWKKQVPVLRQVVGGSKLLKHFEYVLPQLGSQKVREMTEANFPDPTIFYNCNFQYGYLSLITGEQLGMEEEALLERFTRAFELTYRRFLDLQKAEAQAREAQIEAALERVRSRSMAMHKSEELSEVASVLYKEFFNLGISEFVTCGFMIYDESKKNQRAWITQSDGSLLESFNLPLDADIVFKERYQAWKRKELMFHQQISGKTRTHHIGLAINESDSITANEMAANFPDPLIFYNANFSQGYLSLISGMPLSLESQSTLSRFAKVFEQTYTRFLDLQKAEAQAREAQIEAALERVRSRSMAMHKSDELLEAGSLLYHELLKFGISSLTSGYCLMDSDAKMGWNYISNQTDGAVIPKPMGIPHQETDVMRSITQSWKKQDPFLIIQLNEEETITHQTFIAERTINFNMTAKELIARTPKRLALQTFNFKQGYILIVGAEPLPSEKIEMLVRFAKVFEMTYQRFLDLQKAEAQAREAQIEAALERVRSRTMAMQRSDELPEVALVLWEQLKQLNLKGLDGCAIHVYDDEAGTFDAWAAFPDLIEGERKMKLNMFTSKKGCIWAYKEWDRHYRAGEIDFCAVCNKQQLNEFIDWFAPTLPLLAKEFRSFDLDTLYVNGIAFSNGILGAPSFEPLSAETWTAFKRLAAVFDLAYRRFEDLQKAEAQTREAEIELALERIRAKALAMHNSEDLWTVTGVLRNQMALLGEKDLESTIIHIYHKERDEFEAWYSYRNPEDPNRNIIDGKAVVKWGQTARTREDRKKYLDKETNYTIVADHKMLKEWYDHLDEVAPMVLERDDQGAIVVPKVLYYNYSKFSGGALLLITRDQAMEHSKNLLKRSAEVFNLAYTRFLDLQKAEAQARESQIEVALERIRARAMAMHHTDELTDVLGILFDQFDFLGINPVLTHLTLFDEENETFTLRITTGGKNRTIAEQLIDINAVESWKTSFANWKKSELHAVDCIDYPPEVLPAVWEVLDGVMGALPEGQKLYPEDFPDGLYTTQGHCKFGYIGFNHTRRATVEEKEIVIRFAKEFGRLYQRFLDIQKAELQAKEAQIEAALERVRSKTMAMHNSEDVGITVITLFDEVLKLGLDKSIRCGIGILEGTEQMETWSATSYPNGEVDLKVGKLDMTIHPLLIEVKNAWLNGKKGYNYELKGKEVAVYYDALNNAPEYPFHVDLKTLPNKTYHNSFVFSSGILFAFTENPISEDAVKVLDRFASVFGQTYRRYLDLQKAEEQAREGQIEAALERVRSRSMAMQHSSELNNILAKVFEELTSLELEMERAVIWTYTPEDRSVRWWAANPEAVSGSESYFIADQDDPVYNEYWKAWEERRTKHLYILEGDFKENWTDILFNKTEVVRLPDIVKAAMIKPDKLYLYNTFNDFGVLFIACLEPMSEAKFTILERFGKVFDQSYTRFNDIKQAEARAQEAIKQSSLDRVRGQIASMRSTADLDRITPLVWDELTTLGIPFIRCGVFIINEATQIVNAYLSSPKGESLGVLNLPFTASTLTSASVAYWREKKVLHQHWNREEFMAWTASLIEQGLLKNKATYQGSSEPPESLDLHFIPFDQGMLYVGSEAALSSFQIDLVQALANAFSVAYARYEDFAELEKAKESVETTLNELKATQNQLVQSEKMASLGELTAGIAHEIQNPLNFVNNFSEVSKELLEEMMEEMEKGDTEEVKALAEDVIQNLEKIVHHGKRADGIVKGMLQHSRNSSGVKEPTDLNVLADEYLRLAYHGLRAKDKTFNATLETHFDESINKVNVVAQEMGRVILNLITNAFYVVKEKKEKQPEGYEPTVIVTTRKEEGRVVIAVKDNGNGIPDAIKDKIFQPFFTTKPTGQGTGLGLSMSYDIVTKGHGGELKVETTEGEGTEFIINLSIS
jgi:signal transduction histidine kinase